MEVIGVGLGRTGTLSLKTALEALGLGPCYHMKVIGDNLQDISKWIAVAEAADAGQQPDFEAIFKPANGRPRFRASADHPAAGYYKLLLAAYPKAKFVLTVRDSAEAWYASAASTIHLDALWGLRVIPIVRKFKYMVQRTVWDNSRVFDGKFDDKEWAIKRYHSWIDEVKATVPSGQLLIFNVKQGWEPLCSFLGTTVPEGVPFPWANDRKDFMRQKLKMEYFLAALSCGVLAVGVSAIICIVRFLSMAWS